MDEYPDRHPYRCLPMTIANAYGWEIVSPVDFEAEWNGGPLLTDIAIHAHGDLPAVKRLVNSHFGRGVLTFHTGYLFQTDPDWELVATGPTNEPKDGIAFLTGVVETHWLTFPFTMNWRFTRPGIVRWSKGEPFCLVYPVARQAIPQTEPVIRSLDSNPQLKEQYDSWSKSRGEFLQDLKNRDAEAVKQGWQRHYFRGERVADGLSIEDHLKKLRPAKPIVMDEPVPTNPSAEFALHQISAPTENVAPKGGEVQFVGASYVASAAPGYAAVAHVAARSSAAAPAAVSVASPVARSTSPAAPTVPASYFICTTPRSGSYLLAQSLESTGIAGRPEEYFDARFEAEWRAQLKVESDSDYFEKIKTRGRSANEVFGAKVLQFQCENLATRIRAVKSVDDPLDPAVLSEFFGPLKFIWLRREDGTAQAISWLRAIQSQEWYRFVGETDSPRDDSKLKFDALEIADLKAKLRSYNDGWRAYFERWKIPVLEIVYEDFVHEFEETIRRILDFLACDEARTAKSPTRRHLRQADDLSFEWAYRYALEFPEEVVKTPLARAESDRYNREGAGLFQRGDFAAAEPALRRALEWDGSALHVVHNLASALASQRKFDEAIGYFRRALRIDPECADVCRNLALAYERSGSPADAEVYYRKAAALKPGSFDLGRTLAKLQRRAQPAP
jgi:LPS sulfotransferase NodH